MSDRNRRYVLESAAPTGAPAGMEMTRPVQTDVGQSSAVVAAAERARAAIQARALMAKHRPRNIDEARLRILADCRRPGFAPTARYSKPVGGSAPASGFTIRFAEAALRAWGNADVSSEVVYEDDDQRSVRVSVVDLETNASYSTDVLVAKTVERSDPKGRDVLGQRVNTKGKPVYIVEATEEEMVAKVASAVSKAIRTCGLRLIPGDIQDDAQAVILETIANRDAQDPAATRKAMLDSFAALGVRPADIEAYLRHPLDQCTPYEVSTVLQGIYSAIRCGETTWHEVVDAAEPAGDSAAKNGKPREPEPPPPTQPRQKSDASDVLGVIDGASRDVLLRLARELADMDMTGTQPSKLPAAVALALAERGVTPDEARAELNGGT